MHDAIASGAMPKVNPWGDIQALYTPRPTIEARKPLREALATFDIPEDVMTILNGDDPEGGMDKYLALKDIEKEKTRAHEAAEATIAATAAKLHTGPASKKRRREAAAKADRQRANGNTRARKLPRVVNSALASNESSNTPPVLQQPRRNVADLSAPMSNNETPDSQQPH